MHPWTSAPDPQARPPKKAWTSARPRPRPLTLINVTATDAERVAHAYMEHDIVTPTPDGETGKKGQSKSQGRPQSPELGRRGRETPPPDYTKMSTAKRKEIARKLVTTTDRTPSDIARELGLYGRSVEMIRRHALHILPNPPAARRKAEAEEPDASEQEQPYEDEQPPEEEEEREVRPRGSAPKRSELDTVHLV